MFCVHIRSLCRWSICIKSRTTCRSLFSESSTSDELLSNRMKADNRGSTRSVLTWILQFLMFSHFCLMFSYFCLMFSYFCLIFLFNSSHVCLQVRRFLFGSEKNVQFISRDRRDRVQVKLDRLEKKVTQTKDRYVTRLAPQTLAVTSL